MKERAERKYKSECREDHENLQHSKIDAHWSEQSS